MENQKYNINDYTASTSQYFRLGDRVVWLNSAGNSEGTIRWIGKCLKNDFTIRAVVEFDEYVTKEQSICNWFEENPGHGRFIPVGELLKKKDFSVDDQILTRNEKSQNYPNSQIQNGSRQQTPFTNSSSKSFASGSIGFEDNFTQMDLNYIQTSNISSSTSNKTAAPIGNLYSRPTASSNGDKNNNQEQMKNAMTQRVNQSNGHSTAIRSTTTTTNVQPQNKLDEVDLMGQSFILPTPAVLQSQSKIATNFWDEMVSITKNQDNYYPLQTPSDSNNVQVGTKVVAYEGFPVYGQIRWIGKIANELHVGIEFDESIGHFSGWMSGQFLFKCRQNCGVLISLISLRNSTKYRIFEKNESNPPPLLFQQQTNSSMISPNNNNSNGNDPAVHQQEPQKVHKIGQPTILSYLQSSKPNGASQVFSPGKIDLLKFDSCRGNRGIQGKNNSCYIDVALISLFGFTEIFDPLLLIPNKSKSDSQIAQQVRNILVNQIVKPLREKYFTPHEAIYKLRMLLLPFNSKLESQFMDVEEFLYILFDKVYGLKGFINYNSGQTDFIHQIVVTQNYTDRITTIGEIFSRSLQNLGVSLIKMPDPCLILQIPRNRGQLINLNAIVPNLTLNLNQFYNGPNSANSELHLFAIVCTKSSHFVTFVKGSNELLSPWIFFDSNPSGSAPKVEILPKMGEWLMKLQNGSIQKIRDNFNTFPLILQRLLTDIYICFYTCH